MKPVTMAKAHNTVVLGDCLSGAGEALTVTLCRRGWRVFAVVPKLADAEKLQRAFANCFTPLELGTWAGPVRVRDATAPTARLCRHFPAPCPAHVAAAHKPSTGADTLFERLSQRLWQRWPPRCPPART